MDEKMFESPTVQDDGEQLDHLEQGILDVFLRWYGKDATSDTILTRGRYNDFLKIPATDGWCSQLPDFREGMSLGEFVQELVELNRGNLEKRKEE